MSNTCAVRYRRLALIEQDNENARLLRLIADESDRGVLFTADWISRHHLETTDQAQLKPTDAKP
jgi:hypothetical protein